MLNRYHSVHKYQSLQSSGGPRCMWHSTEDYDTQSLFSFFMSWTWQRGHRRAWPCLPCAMCLRRPLQPVGHKLNTAALPLATSAHAAPRAKLFFGFLKAVCGQWACTSRPWLSPMGQWACVRACLAPQCLRSACSQAGIAAILWRPGAEGRPWCPGQPQGAGGGAGSPEDSAQAHAPTHSPVPGPPAPGQLPDTGKKGFWGDQVNDRPLKCQVLCLPRCPLYCHH